MTLIPVIATALASEQTEERYLLGRAGYGYPADVMLTRLCESTSAYAPHGWDGRTMPVAHHYIEEHFDELETGAVIDVEYILGETEAPKASERLEEIL